MLVDHRVIWTPEMDAVLINAARQGIGDRPVHDQIGVDRHTARARRKALGLPHGKKGRRLMTERNSRLLALSEILPIAECAERMGLTYAAAEAAIRRERKRRAIIHGGASDAS